MTDISMGSDFDPTGVVPADSPATTAKATNEYDTLLAQAMGPAPAAPPKPTGNEYDAVVVDLLKERSQRVRSTIIDAEETTPAAAAQAIDLSRKTGMPAAVVEGDLQRVAADQKLNEYDELISKSPKLQQWILRDRINAKVAKDDVRTLADIERDYRKAYDIAAQRGAEAAGQDETEMASFGLAQMPKGGAVFDRTPGGGLFQSQFASGMESGSQAYKTAANLLILRQLRTLDRVDRGEFTAVDRDPYGYIDMTPEQRKEIRDTLDTQFLRNVANIQRSMEFTRTLPRNKTVKPFFEELDKIEAADLLKTLTGKASPISKAAGIFASDWRGILQQLTVENLPNMLPTMAAGMTAGPVGAFLASVFVDAPSRIRDIIQDEIPGVDFNNQYEVFKYLRENPEVAESFYNRGVRGAFGPAVMDALSFGLAKPLTGSAGVVRNTGRVLRNVGAEIVTEMAGETAGQVLADQNIKLSEIIAEGLAAGPMSVATTARASAQEIQADRAAQAFKNALVERGDLVVAATQFVTGLQTVVAEKNALTVDDIMAKAEGSALAKLSPTKLQEFIASLSSPENPAQVYVPADAVMTFMQDMTGLQAQQFADALGITEQLKRIADTKEDVAIPLEKYVTAATEAHKAWREQIRTEVDGFSIAQAQEFEKAKAAELKELQARFEEQVQAGIVADPATVVYNQILGMLKANGYTNEVAAQHAALYAARYETRAARNPGLYADALDAFQQAGPGTGMTIQTVLPDGTRALGPDVFDAILNSIRSGRDPIVPPAHFAHLEARKEAQRAALEPILGPEGTPPPPTPKQVSEARQKAAMEAFKAQRQEVADALASMNLDPATMTNEQIRAAVTKKPQGVTLEQAFRPRAFVEFGRKLDALKAGTLARGESLFMGRTPGALRLSGLPDLPLVYKQSEARKTLLEKHAGLIDEGVLRRLPDMIADPIMVVRQENGRFGVLLDGDILAVVQPRALDANRRANLVVTVHPKDSPEAMLRAVKDGRVVYRNERRSQEWFDQARRQLPGRDPTQGFTGKIATDADLVKTYEQPVYHGSGAIFDRFSLDKIGTGEGAQAFGWGLYFASQKDLAKHYRETLGRYERADGKPLSRAASDAIGAHNGDVDQALKFRRDQLAGWEAAPDDPGKASIIKMLKRDIRDLETAKKKGVKPGGRLYHVEIPEDGAYLLWDRPLLEQPAAVQEALKKLGVKAGPDPKLPADRGIAQIVKRAIKENDGSPQNIALIIDNDADLYRQASDHAKKAGVDIEEDGPGAYVEARAGEYLKALADREDQTGEKIYRLLSEQMMESNDRSRGDKAASLALLAAGIPGIKYLDGGSRADGEGSYNYVLFDDGLAQIKSYEQNARGEISFADNLTTISLFQARDLSTLAHETGHLWLAELEFDAKSKGASDQIKADWQTVLTFLGSDGYITREQHEQFARAFETYLMEGKAPSEGLRSVFRSFKNWLVSIYRNLMNLKAPISPEMREVFDRLVATDEEIASAQNAQGFNPVFTDAKSAGMTEAEFKAYTRRVTQVVDEAEQAVLEKVMASIRKQKTKEVAAEKKKIRGEVTAEMMKDPGNAALHLLRTGMLYGTPVTPMSLVDAKLDRAALVAMIGEEGLQSLPAGIYAAEGINPDDLAQVFGLGNGQELVERLMQIRAEQDAMRAKGDNRSVLNARIAEETQRRLTEALGDPLNDGSIEAEAMAAIHSDKQGALLSSELKVLARKAGHSGTITLDDIKGWAATTIGEMSVYQATQANKFLRAERMAGQAVQRALVKGDFEAAFKAKQDQLVNFALYTEAKKAAEDAESIRKLADRYASADTIKSMDQGALDQIHQILEEFDFKRRSGTLLAERTTWSAWAAEQAAQGFEVIEPPRLQGAGRTHFSQMTMEEIRGLGDTIKQIAHIGRWKQEMIDGARKRAFEELVAEAVETAGKIDQRGVSQMSRGKTSLEDKLGKVGHAFKVADAALLKLETLFEWLDNDKTGRGVFSRLVFKRIADAQTVERDMQADLAGKLKAVYDKVPAEQRKQWSQQHTLPELGQKLNKNEIIAVALNMGNASNMQKMLQGEGWSEAAVRQVLNKYLTKEEWQFVQDTWDLIDSLWPQSEALEKRVNGVAPPKVEATPVETPYGTLKGGYYPMAYDKDGDVKADRIAAKGAEGLYDVFYQRASTRAGSLNKRTEGFNAKVLLNLSVIGQHLNEIAHDIATREAVMDAYKFLSDDRVREAIRSAVGPEYEAQTLPWLKAVANEWAIDKRGLADVEKWLQAARANTTMVGMGFRLTTMLSQVAGFGNSIQRLGTVDMLRGMRDFYKDPAGMAAFVHEKSGEMRHRANDLERDIRLNIKRMQGRDSNLDSVRRFAFRGIALFDAAVSLPTWVGAYNQGLRQGMTDGEAVYYADKMVRDTQGAGSVKDMAALQRPNSEAMKLFTMFYSYFNVFYNRQRGIVRDFRAADSFSDYMDVVAQSMWLMVIPTLMAAMLSGQGPDDDEDWGSWAARNVGFGLFSGIPLVRDVANSASNKIAGKGFGGAKLTPVEGTIGGIERLLSDAFKLVSGEDVSRTAIKNTFNVAGFALGLPTGQVGATAQFLWDALVEGTQDPEGLLEWMRGLVYGSKKEK